MTTDENAPETRTLQGRWYADSFEVGHNALQFKLDCGHEKRCDRGEQMQEFFRVIASPPSARALFRTLGVALLHYADSFGPIDDQGGSHSEGRDE
jgi:hypothetical protein